MDFLIHNINNSIQSIDRLIIYFRAINDTDDINSLRQLKAAFVNQQNNISAAANPLILYSKLHTYGDTLPRLSENLGTINAKIVLPVKFNNLFLSLQKLRQSSDFPWKDSNLEPFYQQVMQQNQVLNSISPQERIQKKRI